MRAIDQVKLLRFSIDSLDRHCERLDGKFYQTRKIMQSALERFDEEFAVLLAKVDVLLDLPLFEATDNGAEPLELEKFMDIIVSIYPDFQDALIMLDEAMCHIRGGDNDD